MEQPQQNKNEKENGQIAINVHDNQEQYIKSIKPLHQFSN